MVHIVWFLATCLGQAAPAATAEKPSSAKSVGDAKELAGQGPLDFRCDNMQVLTKPNRTICRGNVVVRRSDILVCCKAFEGLADDKWEWQRLICNEDVRAQRGDETMWADRAEFVPETSDLVLTGRPLLRRGQSVLEGERVIVNVNEDRARVQKPRGRIGEQEMQGAKTKPASEPAAGELPAVCPVPPTKR